MILPIVIYAVVALLVGGFVWWRVEEMRAEKEEQKRRKIDAEKALLESLLAKYGIPERS